MSKKDDCRNELVSVTSRLMRFKTIKDSLKERKKIIDFIVDYYPKNSIVTKRYVKNNKYSVVLTPRGVQKPKLFFLCHADVVEAENKDFVPKIIGDKLFGRGSADMKSGVAIAMLLFNKYHTQASIGLMITTDEEVGGFNGAGMLSEKYKCDFIIAPECSDLGITVKEKGVIWVKLKAKGKATHGSRPWSGINAADMLIETYEKMRKSIPQIRKEGWKTTMSLGMFMSGIAPNVVPDSAEMTLDIRYTENDSIQMIEKIIDSAIKGKSIDIEFLEKEPLMQNKKNDKNIAMLAKSARKIIGKNPKLNAEHGASDARFFSSKSSCVLFGPSGANFHGKGEYVSISSMMKCYAVLEDLITNI